MAIPTLVVVKNPWQVEAKGRQIPQDSVTSLRVLFHQLELLFGEFAGLGENGFGHPYLADVVEQTGNTDRLRIFGVESQLSSQLKCKQRHAFGMSTCVGILCIDRGRQRGRAYPEIAAAASANRNAF